ncbi:hypothetical protein [Salinarimonas sp.]|uniref:hypothetical protein n=1 Tax=Salinarimonas sp. TaxID=2766526 RepID=UPI0032D9776D
MSNHAQNLAGGLFGAVMAVGLAARQRQAQAPIVRTSPRLVRSTQRLVDALTAEREKTRALSARIESIEAENAKLRRALRLSAAAARR